MKNWSFILQMSHLWGDQIFMIREPRVNRMVIMERRRMKMNTQNWFVEQVLDWERMLPSTSYGISSGQRYMTSSWGTGSGLSSGWTYLASGKSWRSPAGAAGKKRITSDTARVKWWINYTTSGFRELQRTRMFWTSMGFLGSDRSPRRGNALWGILKSSEPFFEMTQNNPKLIQNGYLAITFYPLVKIEVTKLMPNQTNWCWMGHSCPLTPESKFGLWCIKVTPKLIRNGYLAIV